MNEKKTMTKDEALKLDSVQAKPEPERVASQEPVAWMHIENYINEDNLWDSRKLFRDYDNGFGFPLYTAPPQRKPLTDVQIATLYWGATGQSLRPQDNALAHKFARAIEAAHGIKE